MTAYDQYSLLIQGGTLIVYTLTLLVMGVSAWFASKEFFASKRHRIFDRAATSLQAFLVGSWLTDFDRENWNAFLQSIEIINCAGEYSGKFKASNLPTHKGIGELEDDLFDVSEIFTEGPFMDYGSSIVTVITVLEYIARDAINGELDKDFIVLHLYRFFQRAEYFIGLLNNEPPASWANIKQITRSLNQQQEVQGHYLFPNIGDSLFKYQNVGR